MLTIAGMAITGTALSASGIHVPAYSGYSAATSTAASFTAAAAPPTTATCTETMRAGVSSMVLAYRLNEGSGSYYAGDFSNNGNHGIYHGSMVSDRTSPLVCPRDGVGSYRLDGETSFVSTPQAYDNPQEFTMEVWFGTTTAGGRLIGFGNAQTGLSQQYDRHLYMTDAGEIVFGVYPLSVVTIKSAPGYDDGQWHHAVATLSPDHGMTLYLDGVQVASDPTTTAAEPYTGYWRIGGDNLAQWGPTTPTNHYFKGDLRFAAVYNRALPAETIAAHHAAGQ